MAQPAEAQKDSSGDASYAAAIGDFLRRYHPVNAEPKPDILEGRYQINVAAPAPELDTKSARAYAVSDLVDSSRQLFALVCAAGTVQRGRAIQQMKNVDSPNVMKPLAAGVVSLSQPAEQRFVIVYERPRGRKLSALLAESSGAINENFLCRNIIEPIAAAIEKLAAADIAHGAINPDNIFFQETLMLGDCLSAPCGYDQVFYYEPLERLQALPSGKGESGGGHDYYALAILALQVIYGEKHFADITPETLIISILREGAHNALMRGREPSEKFEDFFRGLLCQNAADRWNNQQIRPWLEGKRYNVLTPSLPAANRPFEFAGQQAGNRRELAHLFFLNWGQIVPALEKGQLAQWIAVSLRNKELSDGVLRISKSLAELGGKNEVQTNEQLMRLLLLLDPEGPIRIGPLAFHPDGIDALCADLFFAKSEKNLPLLARVVEFNMVGSWLEIKRKDPDYAIPATVNAMTIRLDRLRMCIRNNGYGFGLERMLYELNPDMPCQSPVFAGQCIMNLPSLLAGLDRMAASRSGNDDPLDRHLAAFIGAKINLQHELKLHELASIPALAAHRSIMALKLLATAQQKIGDMQLPGLTHWLALRILPALDVLRSRTLRHRMKASLMEYAASGSLSLLAGLIINPNYASADQNGFSQAWSLYQYNNAQISSYRKGENVDNLSNKLGLTMSKLIACVVFLITIASIMNDY